PLPRRDAARSAAERLRVVADGADHADLGLRGLWLRGRVPDPVQPRVLAPAPDHPAVRNVPEDGHQGWSERLTCSLSRTRPPPRRGARSALPGLRSRAHVTVRPSGRWPARTFSAQGFAHIAVRVFGGASMNTALMAAPRAAPIALNQPGTYLHWSIFEISVANLVVIAVMVVIFGAALLLPFPRVRCLAPAPEVPPDAAPQGEWAANLGDDSDARMWTSRVRRWALRVLPPRKLLPDRQPAYVASWVYVFGVATLAALGLAIVSGFAIALGGTDWWHTNPVGHFFNSTHLWSVELFMAFMVIHLWGKFWMAAWRGRRALTWITGVVAFGASIVECFTGYLSQQNFDSQWI